MPPRRLDRQQTSPAEVTAVVWTYNHEPYVRDCLDAILRQETSFPVNVVVHDDASTDGTASILEEIYRSSPSRLTVILQGENQMSRGVSGADVYVNEVTTPYLAMCDGDDLWTDDRKLERQVSFMRLNPWCSVSHHGISLIDESEGHPYHAWMTELLDDPWRQSPRLPGTELAERNFIMACSAMLRTSALRPEVLRAFVNIIPEDWVLFALAGESGYIGYLPEVMAAYRLHGANAWAGSTDDDRQRASADALWFMSVHLRGEMQQRAQDALLRMLQASPAVRRPVPLADLLQSRASLESSLESDRAEIGRLSAEVALLGAEVSRLNADVSARDDAVRSLQGRLAAFRSGRSAFQLQFEAVESERSRLATLHRSGGVQPTSLTPLYLLTGVWDNADLLDSWLRHHRSLGVAGVLALDYGSTDGSIEILRSAEWAGFVELVPFTGLQSDTNRALLDHARATIGQGWALLIDPDEFAFTGTGDLSDAALQQAMSSADLLTVARFDMTGPRSIAERRTPGSPSVGDLTLRFVERDLGKVLVDLASGAVASLSGHEGQGAQHLDLGDDGMCLLHAPVRSFAKFAEKVDHAAVTLAANPGLPDAFAHHWRRWVLVRDEGGLFEEYLEQFVPDAEIAGLIARGTYVQDLRLSYAPAWGSQSGRGRVEDEVGDANPG